MINKRELRIGNLVNVTSTLWNKEVVTGIETVFAISNSGINENGDLGESGPATFSQLNPIPLTEEWLQRFGFIVPEFAMKGEWLHVLGKEPGNTGIRYHFLDRKASFYKVAIKGEIKYVHQLQNLFFMLEGRELEIKQKV